MKEKSSLIKAVVYQCLTASTGKCSKRDYTEHRAWLLHTPGSVCSVYTPCEYVC